MKRKEVRKTKAKQRVEIRPFQDRPIMPTVLEDGWELSGILDAVQPYGDGLIHVSMMGLERLVSDELERDLRPLIGQKVIILRYGRWSAGRLP